MLIQSDFILLTLFSFLSLFFGYVVWRKSPRSQKNIVFGILAVFTTLWMLTSFFEDVEQIGLEYRFLLLKFDYALGVCLAYSFLAFCLSISGIFVERRYLVYFAFIPPLFLVPLILFSGYVISGYEIVLAGVINALFGPLGSVLDSLIVVGALVGVVLIMWQFRKSGEGDRAQFVYLLIGFLLTLGAILSTNIFFTGYIESSNYYNIITRFGSYSAVFLIVLPGHAMVRFRLLNIRIVSTEILSLALLMISLVQALTATSFEIFLINALVFILVLVLAVLLISSMEKEFQRKEELQTMADKLTMANQRLKKLDKAKSEFISIASHQLRTPLTSIKGFISLILEGSYGPVVPEVQNALNKVYLSNERLIQLVEDLLNVSRIESGRLKFDMKRTDVVELVKDTVEMFTLRAREKGLSLAVKTPSGKQIPELMIDANKIREVISNLVDNAIKYTMKGGVTVSIERHIGTVRIIVTDTGMGVETEDMPYLFQKFSRGKDVDRVHANGTGLGLYVGKNLVEAHHGKIWMESDGKDKGSKFSIELPVKIAGNAKETINMV